MPERARHTRRGPRPVWLSTPVLGLAAVAVIGGGVVSLLVGPHGSAPVASSAPGVSASPSRVATPLASGSPASSHAAHPPSSTATAV